MDTVKLTAALMILSLDDEVFVQHIFVHGLDLPAKAGDSILARQVKPIAIKFIADTLIMMNAQIDRLERRPVYNAVPQ